MTVPYFPYIGGDRLCLGWTVEEDERCEHQLVIATTDFKGEEVVEWCNEHGVPLEEVPWNDPRTPYCPFNNKVYFDLSDPNHAFAFKMRFG